MLPQCFVFTFYLVHISMYVDDSWKVRNEPVGVVYFDINVNNMLEDMYINRIL